MQLQRHDLCRFSVNRNGLTSESDTDLGSLAVALISWFGVLVKQLMVRDRHSIAWM